MFFAVEKYIDARKYRASEKTVLKNRTAKYNK